MNKLLRTIGIAALLLTMPLRQFGQVLPSAQNPTTIDFSITEIHNFDERIIFMHQLLNDSRFDVMRGENEGVFIISADPAFEGMDLRQTFADFRQDNSLLFSSMDKEQAAATAMAFKALLPNEITMSLMMDVYIQSRQNNHCATADPFCTDNGMYEFPAGVDAGNGEGGPDYDCLHTTPNPAWYFMRIGTPGNINIYMYSTPGVDIDFCCWGPFDDPETPCPNGLTEDKVVSCSYSGNATETCMIPNGAQTGEYYILVITNYSNQVCDIHFSKTNGTGTTDCGIMPPLVNNDGPYCFGDDIHLTANGQSGASYHWTGPNGFDSHQQNPTITNCTMEMAGTYSCFITVGAQTSDPIGTQVVIYPQPTASFTSTTVCQGELTQFQSTATTTPANMEITSYLWDFGDGETSTEQNPTHLFATAGIHNVSLTVACGHGACTHTRMQNVTVNALPVADAGRDQTIPYGDRAQLQGSGGTGSNGYQYHWEPANMVTNPDSQDTQTVPLVTEQHFTLTVTNPQGQCVDSDEIAIYIQGEAMIASASASPNTICQGESTQLELIAGGGTGNFSYSWTPTQGLSDPSIENPIATPTQTTQYWCHVGDGQTSLDIPVTVTVNMHSTSEINENLQCDSYDWQFGWNGETYTFTESGNYTKTIETYQGCDSIVTLNLHLDYTPSFPSVEGNGWVIGGSEFQYTVEDYWIETDPRSTHETTWTLKKADDTDFALWDLFPFGANNDSCRLFIYTYELEKVKLIAHTSGPCGEHTDYKMIACSSYGTQETSTNLQADIYPNPNDGSMTFSFGNMVGDIQVKAYDITGTLVDSFYLHNNIETQTFTHTVDLPNGVYFFSIASKEGVVTKKVIIMK